MTILEFNQILEKLGLPYAYHFFPVGEVPPLPYFVYYFPSQSSDYADDTKEVNINQINIELYTKSKDFQLEQSFENILSENGLNFSKEETYLETEQMYEVFYEMEDIIDG